MLSRTSHVNKLLVKNVVFSSILQIGDSTYVDSTSHALAVLQEDSDFSAEDEDDFSLHPIFNYRSPIPVISEKFTMITTHLSPKICVNNIEILAVSTSSLVQIGNAQHVRKSNRLNNMTKFFIAEDE